MLRTVLLPPLDTWYDVVVFKSLVAVTLYALALFLNPNSDMVVSLAATAAPAVALACRGICGFAGTKQRVGVGSP